MQHNDETILFFGGIRDGEYESLLAKGFKIIVIADEGITNLPSDTKGLFLVEKMPLLNLSIDTIKYLEKLIIKYKVSTTICVMEYFMESYAKLLSEIKKPGISNALTALCTDKTEMHRLFIEKIGSHATAQYQIINNEEELFAFANKIQFPIVLKPHGLYGSLFVSFSDTQKSLKENYHSAKNGIDEYLKRIKSKKEIFIQAEEYLAGSNHSVDCVVLKNGDVIPTPVIDVITGKDIGRKDFHHFARVAPSSLSEAQQKEVIDLAIQGVRALGLFSCAAHVELIYTKKGPKLLEIGARPGANRIKMLWEVFGIDLMYAHYQGLNDQQAHIQISKQNPFAVVTPYPVESGILEKAQDRELVSQLSTYANHRLKAKLGSKIGSPQAGYLSPLSIELKSNDLDAILGDIHKIKNFDELFILSS